MDDISYGNLTISLYYHKVFIDGHELDFPRREFDLLYLLVSSPGRVFTFRQLAQEVWGDDYEPTENSLHSCVQAKETVTFILSNLTLDRPSIGSTSFCVFIVTDSPAGLFSALRKGVCGEYYKPEGLRWQ